MQKLDYLQMLWHFQVMQTKSLGERIREERMLAGLTLAQTAQRLMVDITTINRWELHGGQPHPRSRKELARLFPRLKSELQHL